MSIMATTPSPLENNDLVFACLFLKVTEKKLRSCHESANNEMTFSNYQGNLVLTKQRFQSSVLAEDCELQKSLESSVQFDPICLSKAHMKDQFVYVISYWTFCNIILYNILYNRHVYVSNAHITVQPHGNMFCLLSVGG